MISCLFHCSNLELDNLIDNPSQDKKKEEGYLKKFVDLIFNSDSRVLLIFTILPLILSISAIGLMPIFTPLTLSIFVLISVICLIEIFRFCIKNNKNNKQEKDIVNFLILSQTITMIIVEIIMLIFSNSTLAAIISLLSEMIMLQVGKIIVSGVQYNNPLTKVLNNLSIIFQTVFGISLLIQSGEGWITIIETIFVFFTICGSMGIMSKFNNSIIKKSESKESEFKNIPEDNIYNYKKWSILGTIIGAIIYVIIYVIYIITWLISGSNATKVITDQTTKVITDQTTKVITDQTTKVITDQTIFDTISTTISNIISQITSISTTTIVYGAIGFASAIAIAILVYKTGIVKSTMNKFATFIKGKTTEDKTVNKLKKGNGPKVPLIIIGGVVTAGVVAKIVHSRYYKDNIQNNH